MVERAGTDLVAILNADDWHAPNRLSRILALRHSGAPFFAFSGGRVFMGTVDGRLIALSQTDGTKVWDTDVIGDAYGIAEDASALPAQQATQTPVPRPAPPQ